MRRTTSLKAMAQNGAWRPRLPSICYLGHFHIQQSLFVQKVQRAAQKLAIVGIPNSRVFVADNFVDVMSARIALAGISLSESNLWSQQAFKIDLAISADDVFGVR